MKGLDRTRYAIAERLLGLTPRLELTAMKLRRARRRRIDVARGFRDGRTAISAGWQLPWPE